MIRSYSPADQLQLLAILKLNTPQYFHPSEADDFFGYLTHHLESYFVVEEDGKIIGAGGINYFPAEGTARISWDIIHPDFQGKGVGKKLMEHRIKEIRDRPDISQIMVRTTQLVYPFYEKMGFTLEHTEQNYWAPGFDLYQMRMLLKSNPAEVD